MISNKSWKNANMKVNKPDSTNKTNSTCHPCVNCTKVFPSVGKLQQHSFVHSGEKPFKCTNCDKSFSSKFKLMRHTLIHSSVRKYSCNICERCFHRKDHLKNHLQVHNPNKKVHRCEHCSKEYNSRLSFRKHVAIHAAEAGDLNCKVCNKNFKTSEEILYHLKVHAGSRTIKNPNEKKFKCDFCERRFFTRKDVKRHLVVHTGRRDFLCQFCPQRFGRKDHLVRHIKKGHPLPSTQGHKTPKQIIPDAQITNKLPSSTISNDPLPLLPKMEPHLPEFCIHSTDAGPSGLFPMFGIKAERFDEFQPRNNCMVKLTETYESDRFYGYIPVSSSAALPLTAIINEHDVENGDDVPPLPRFSQAFQ